MRLLTGSQGFIGRYIDAKYRLDPKSDDTIYPIIPNDVDLVIHLGAESSIGRSVEDPIGTYEKNLSSLIHIIRECQRVGAHLIFASSASVKDPKSPYAWSKLIGEKIIKESGISATILRFGNVYGPGDDKSAIYWFGQANIIDLHGGEQLRTFIHVEDIVAAIEHYAVSREKGIFNLGVETHTMLEVAQYFNKPVKFSAMAPSDSVDLSFPSEVLREGKSLKTYIDENTRKYGNYL